jgi:phospholipid-binding lipoprotein MlaA
LLLLLLLVVSGCGTAASPPRLDVLLAATDFRAESVPAVEREPIADATVATGLVAPLVAPLSVEGLSARDNELWLRDRTTDGSLLASAWAPAGEWPSAQARNDDDEDDEYVDEFAAQDPFERFNEKVFRFNYNLDRFVLKPVARVYNKIMPEPFQVMISNGFDNIAFVPRLVNSALQGKWDGAGREMARFLINSTAGIGGLFDPAGDYWGIRKSREDFGQTLGWYGVGPGPYLILPFLEPLTIRDGIGRGVDSLLDPLTWLLPLFWDRLGMRLGDTLNERSLNLELFQGFEEGVVDLYSAVRHGYLQRRRQLIQE